jgi:hypothetical protein
MGIDLVAALYRGLTTYADITRANGETSLTYKTIAQTYQNRIDTDWWDENAGLYHTHYTNDHKFGKTEGETFLLWFDALKDTTRKQHTIRHLLTLDLNVENLSYLPLQYYRNGYLKQARDLILRLASPSTQRREYPEVSYGMVEAIVQGLMGVEVDARTKTVSTLYRGTGTSQLTNLPVLNTTITLVHNNKQTSITNTGKFPFKWRAQKISQGRVVACKEVGVAPGQQINMKL